MAYSSLGRAIRVIVPSLCLIACDTNVIVDGTSKGGEGGEGGGGGSASSGTSPPGCDGLPCFSLAEPQPVGNGAQDLLLTDCNADGHIDIVVANSEAATISVLVGHGDGSFDLQKTYAAGLHPWMLAEGDFDGDGRGDLAVANFVRGAGMMMGDGACGFAAATPVLDEDPLGDYSSAALTVAVADLDADGHNDIVAEAVGPGGAPAFFTVLYGQAGGAFEPPVTLPVGTRSSDIVIHDLDGDGFLDILGSTHWLGGSPAFVHVVRGMGDRTFADAVDLPVGTEPDGLALGDFDADGLLDIAVPGGVNLEMGAVSLLRGDGKGGFHAQITFPTGLTSNGIAAGDLNADGFSDVVVGLGSENAVAILRGGPGGELTPPVIIPIGDNPLGSDLWEPYYVALGDLNEDGVLDVAATNFVGNVSLLLSK
jgi:hypothetical protein